MTDEEQAKYDGLIAVNSEQVTRLNTAMLEVGSLRICLQRAEAKEQTLNERIKHLEIEKAMGEKK